MTFPQHSDIIKKESSTQLGIYETGSFSKVDTLFADDQKMFLECLESDIETNICYVLGFMRDNNGILDYGFAGIFIHEKQTIENIRKIGDDYGYLHAYKRWELSGFTEKSLEWNSRLNKLKKITPVSIKEVYDRS